LKKLVLEVGIRKDYKSTKHIILMTKEIGIVTHYFANIKVGAIKLSGNVKKEDKLHITGETTNFEQTLDSIQINRKEVEEAKKGDEIGVKFKERVRSNDKVYKVE
jgi:translation elongation factor EF-Tu-like GTPase